MAQGPFGNNETGRHGAPVAQAMAILAQTCGEFKWAARERASNGINWTDRTAHTDRMIVVESYLDRTLRNVEDSSQ